MKYYTRLVALLLVVVLIFSNIPTDVVADGGKSDVVRYSVLVIDTSDTETFNMNSVPIYTADTALPYVISASQSFLKGLLEADGENYVAVVTIGEKTQLLCDFTASITDVKKTLSSITSKGTERSITDGLNMANELIGSVKDEKAIKNVILVTTGLNDDGDYTYSGKYNSRTIGSSWYDIATGVKLYAFANSAIMAAERVKKQAELYVLGLFQTMAGMPQEGKAIVDFFKLFASDLASSSQFYDVKDLNDIKFKFGEIADDIMSEFVTYHGMFKYAGNLIKQCDTISDYYYSDGYFFKDSTENSPLLATMSIALELSSWSSIDKSEWYNNTEFIPGQGKSQAFFQDKLVNAKTLLIGENPEKVNDSDAKDGIVEVGWNGIGFNHFRANGDWGETPTMDSIGVCAARKQIEYDDERYTLVAVAIRGGKYGSEWASNFTLESSGEHAGFAMARDKVLTWLNEYLSDLEDDESQELKLWIVGYSRAGATANMVTGKIDEDPSIIKHGRVKRENIYCYAFEPPRGIANEKNGGIYSNIHNYVNVNDVVTLVAPEVWNFTRYNMQNDYSFPSQYTVSDWENNREDMKKQLENMGFTSFANNDFAVWNTVYTKAFRFDRSKLLPGGDPLWWFEDQEISTQEVLDNTVDYLFDSFFAGRNVYVNRLQTTFRLFLGVLAHYDGFAAGAKTYLKQTLTKKFEIMSFLKDFLGVFSWDNLSYCLEPLVEINLKSLQRRKDEAGTRILEVITKELAEYSFIFSIAQVKIALDELISNLKDAFYDMATDILNNNTTDINTIGAFFSLLKETNWKIVQPHYAEITYAWLRSLNPYYNKKAKYSMPRNAVTRVIHINCPVDIKVYDSANKLKASFTNDVPDRLNDSSIVYYTNKNDEKILYLPSDMDYRIAVKARDAGKVNVSINEYNMVQQQRTRLRNYYDIGVQKGDNIQISLEAIKEKELDTGVPNGSSAKYILSHNGSEVKPAEEYFGNNVDNKTHEVQIICENNGGFADGAGSYLQGTFAKAEAITIPSGSFLGWYSNNKLVSVDPVYRFAVRSDTVLTAKFNDVNLHHIQVVADKGGKVYEVNGYFSKGTRIALQAQADEGKFFSGWDQNGKGAIDNKNIPNTMFTVGDTDAVLVARFGYHTLPPTGDSMNLSLWLTVLLINMAAVIVIILKVKRSTNED